MQIYKLFIYFTIDSACGEVIFVGWIAISAIGVISVIGNLWQPRAIPAYEGITLIAPIIPISLTICNGGQKKSGGNVVCNE